MFVVGFQLKLPVYAISGSLNEILQLLKLPVGKVKPLNIA